MKYRIVQHINNKGESYFTGQYRKNFIYPWINLYSSNSYDTVLTAIESFKKTITIKTKIHKLK